MLSLLIKSSIFEPGGEVIVSLSILHRYVRIEGKKRIWSYESLDQYQRPNSIFQNVVVIKQPVPREPHDAAVKNEFKYSGHFLWNLDYSHMRIVSIFFFVINAMSDKCICPDRKAAKVRFKYLK